MTHSTQQCANGKHDNWIKKAQSVAGTTGSGQPDDDVIAGDGAAVRGCGQVAQSQVAVRNIGQLAGAFIQKVMVRPGVGIEDDIVLAGAAYDAQYARIDQAVQRVVDRGQSDGLSLLANFLGEPS